MTYTDDCYTLRIPRLTGWRTLTVNAAFVLVGAYLILATGHAEAGAAMALVALANVIMRLCTRTAPARSADMLGVLCHPRRDDRLMATMTATANAVQPDRIGDARLLTELASALDAPARARQAYRASTVVLTGLGAFWSSFLFTLTAMVL